MIGKGTPNQMLEEAGTIAFDDVEEALLKNSVVEPKARENSAGSFERFMSMLGNGGQRPV